MIGASIKNFEEKIVNEANVKLALFMSRRSVGVDIADRSIEVVELERLDGNFKVNSGRSLLPEGLVKHGRIVDEKKLAEILKDTFAQAKPEPILMDRVVFGLPESQVYSHVFAISQNIEKNELAGLVRREAETAIPVPIDDQLYSFKTLKGSPLGQNEAGMKALIMAVSRTVAVEWRDFFKKNGVKAIILDFETIACYRIMLSEKSKPPVCIVDIGAEQTIFAILNSENLFYSYSLGYAGEALTQKILADAILSGRPLEYGQAEEIKITKGLEPANNSAEVIKSLEKALEPIMKQIKIALAVGEERSGSKIKKIVLTGGSASLPGLANFLSRQLNGISLEENSALIEVKVGIPDKLGKSRVDIKCLEAAGLALRVMERGLSEELDINEPFNSRQKNEQPAEKKKIAKPLPGNETVTDNMAAVWLMKYGQGRILFVLVSCCIIVTVYVLWQSITRP